MDPALQPLVQCLEGSLSPDQNIRKRAELELKNADRSAGFVGALLTVVTMTEMVAVQQAGMLIDLVVRLLLIFRCRPAEEYSQQALGNG